MISLTCDVETILFCSLQIVYSPRPERTVRFCQQTSVTDFENQRSSTSQSALKDLLEGIISDKNMSGKEKAKRLKQVMSFLILLSK